METRREVTVPSKGRGGRTPTSNRGRPRTRNSNPIPASPTTRKRTAGVDVTVTPKKKNKGANTPVKNVKKGGSEPQGSPHRPFPQSSSLPVEDDQVFLCSTFGNTNDDSTPNDSATTIHHYESHKTVTVSQYKQQTTAPGMDIGEGELAGCNVVSPVQFRGHGERQLIFSPSPYADNTPARRLPSSKKSTAVAQQKKTNGTFSDRDVPVQVREDEVIKLSSSSQNEVERLEQNNSEEQSTEEMAVDVHNFLKIEIDNVVTEEKETPRSTASDNPKNQETLIGNTSNENPVVEIPEPYAEMNEISDSSLSVGQDMEHVTLNENSILEMAAHVDTNTEETETSGSYRSEGQDKGQDVLDESTDQERSANCIPVSEPNSNGIGAEANGLSDLTPTDGQDEDIDMLGEITVQERPRNVVTVSESEDISTETNGPTGLTPSDVKNMEHDRLDENKTQEIFADGVAASESKLNETKHGTLDSESTPSNGQDEENDMLNQKSTHDDVNTFESSDTDSETDGISISSSDDDTNEEDEDDDEQDVGWVGWSAPCQIV